MTEKHDRLRQARERKGFSGPKEAAVAYGWNVNSYSSNENGNAPFSFKAAEKYARALGVRAEWLYSGTGEMRDEPRPRDRPIMQVPLISWVSAGQLAETGHEITPDDDEYVMLAGLPLGRYFATRVSGDSMDRYSPEGSIIIVNAEDLEPRSGRAYIFSIRGETTYKVFHDEPVVRLEPYSTNPGNKTIYPAPDRDLRVVGRVVRTILDLP